MSNVTMNTARARVIPWRIAKLTKGESM